MNTRDNHFIELIRNQDQTGLAGLYDEYASPLLGIIIRIVKNKELAEEILQQTMLKVWNKISLYDPDKSNLFTWIAKIARNTAIDKSRLKSFSNIQKTDSLDSTVLDIAESQESSLKMDVQKMTSILDPKYKLVLDKLYLEGYSQSDLSKELDIPLGTIKTRVRMAINILRTEFKDEKKYFLGLLLLSLLAMLWL